MIVDLSRVLLTGGSGRLGRELRTLLPGIVAPSRAELDVTCPDTISRALDHYQPQVVLHAAAYTNVSAAERERDVCWRVNVEGTRNLVQAVMERGLFLIHISTDYVFEGTKGSYKEDDPIGPVRNYYALSKLVGEELVRICPNHLVIRTSFRPREWPYPVAFADVFTSQDYVDVIAPKVAQAVKHHSAIPFHTIHVATERKSVYELALRRRADVEAGSKLEAGVQLPDDISLDISRWIQLVDIWKEQHS